MKYTVILLSALFLISCGPQGDPNEEIDEGKIENGTYRSDDIGWTMDIPDDWEITTMEQTNENLEKGSELFENELGVEVDYSGLNNLLAFQKDQFNNFSSTSEQWVEDGILSWSETNDEVKSYITQVYEGQGIAVDSSYTRTVDIDGVSFKSYTFTINAPDGSPMFKQVMYAALINGYDFSTVLMYNNEADKNEMMKVWMASKFE